MTEKKKTSLLENKTFATVWLGLLVIIQLFVFWQIDIAAASTVETMMMATTNKPSRFAIAYFVLLAFEIWMVVWTVRQMIKYLRTESEK